VPTYATITLDARGPEPLLRALLPAPSPATLLPHVLTDDDLRRVEGFPLESLALLYTGNEDLAWVLRDVNVTANVLLDNRTLAKGDTVLIPRTWLSLAADGAANTTARTREVP
jgi:hypothetical protein